MATTESTPSNPRTPAFGVHTIEHRGACFLHEQDGFDAQPPVILNAKAKPEHVAAWVDAEISGLRGLCEDLATADGCTASDPVMSRRFVEYLGFRLELVGRISGQLHRMIGIDAPSQGPADVMATEGACA